MSPNRTERRRPWFISLRVVAVYLVLSLVWILVSDAVVSRMSDDAQTLTRLQTIKGWAFIIVTSLLLYGLILHALRQQRRFDEGMSKSTAQLDLLLRQMPAIVWTTDADLRMTSAIGGGLAKAGAAINESVGRHLGELIEDLPDKEEVLSLARAVLNGEEKTYQTDRHGRYYDTTMVPLRADSGEVRGILALAVDVTPTKEAEREQIQALERLRRSNEQRDRLVRHLVRAEKAERDRIASGIHDDSIQVMTSAGMALDLLLSKLEDPSAVNLAQRARGYVGSAIKRLRTLVFELRPIELDNNRVAVALRLLLDQSAEEAGFAYEVQDNLQIELTEANRYLIYRIAQEAITNVRKHSRAKRVLVSLDEVDEGVRVLVEDDGVGIDAARSVPRDHFGLRDMQERAQVVGGRLEIASLDSGGTRVEFWIPVSPEGLRSEAS